MQDFFRNYSLIFVFFILLFVGASIFVDGFFSTLNLFSVLLAVSQVGIVSCTMMFCLSLADVDLSIGSVVAFCGVLCAVLLQTNNIVVSILLSLLAGAGIGLFNGVIVAHFRINALITTLATMQIVRGLGYLISNGNTIGIFNESFFQLGIGQFLGVGLPVWVMITCFIVFGLLLNQSIFGRNALLAGGNPQAARLAGINVVRTRTIIFIMQGTIAGLAGIVLSARFSSGQPTAALGFELDVISACVLGGVSLMGGQAKVGGVLVAVFIIGIVQNILDLQGVDAFYQYLVRGLILIFALLLDQIKNRLQKV